MSCRAKWRHLKNQIQRFLDFARNDKIDSCELPQKSQIILREESNIGNVEQDHGEPIHAKSECITAPLFRIVSVIATRFVDRFKNGRMHHAATSYFDPLLAAFQSF